MGANVPDTDTNLGRITVEHATGDGVGVGFRGSAYGSRWGVDEGNSTSTTSLAHLSVYPHLMFLGSADPVRIPIRIGPEFRRHDVDLGTGSVGESKYRGFGVAAEIEPEWTFARSDNFAAAVFGRLHVGAGLAAIDGFMQDDSTHATNFEGEVGIRLQASVVSISLGVLGQQTRYGVSGDDNGTRIAATEFNFRGVFFSLGAVW